MTGLLEIAAPEAVDLTDGAALQQLLGQTHRRDEAIVEAAHMLHPGLGHRLQHRRSVAHRHGQRFLADDVLSGLGGPDRRRVVLVVWRAIVQDVDVWILEHQLPVGVVAPVAEARRHISHLGLVPPAHSHQLGIGGGLIETVGNLKKRVRMNLPHEAVAEHADAHPAPGKRPVVDCRKTFGSHLCILLPLHGTYPDSR
jgi:hypothetical protein